jgi:Uma2 family endonuclease
MATITKMTFDDFMKLPEREGPIYELDEGELLMEPSPTLRHQIVRQRIARRLSEFVETHRLGAVLEEMDFRLGPDTVRNPDVAVVTTEHLKRLDLDRSPAEGAPALAVEVVSPSNSAQDMRKKVRQYLNAGSRAVWVAYPALSLVERYTAAGIHTVSAPDTVHEDMLFAGFTFSLSLVDIFAEDPQRA